MNIKSVGRLVGCIAFAMISIGCGGGGSGGGVTGKVPGAAGLLSKPIDVNQADVVTLLERMQLSGSESSTTTFEIVVPAGVEVLDVRTTGGSGDVDLVLSTAGMDLCSSASFTNTENCQVLMPEPGTYVISLFGFRSFDGVNLTAITGPLQIGGEDERPEELEVGLMPIISDTELQGLEGALDVREFEVTGQSFDLGAQLAGGTGDADLALIYQDPENGPQVVCVSLAADNNESCLVSCPLPGTWEVFVEAFTDYSGASLIVDTLISSSDDVDAGCADAPRNVGQAGVDRSDGPLVPPTPDPLPPNTSLETFVFEPALSDLQGSAMRFGPFRLTTQNLDFFANLTGGVGDADLVVSLTNGSGESLVQCQSFNADSEESCLIEGPQVGDWFVEILGFSDYQDVTLTIDSVTCVAENGCFVD